MIGRENEIKALRDAMESDKSEFVALYGRRRVGKTFLVSEFFNGKFAFHHAGLEGASRRETLASFREAIKKQGRPSCTRLTTWIQAFSELESLLEESPKGRKVVFLDELPGYDTPKSGFLHAFESFWNGWASLRKDILLVICGSATTWIIEKVIRNRGGLHNRVTRQLPIAPFTLKECEEYARYKHLDFDRTQIAECYMAFGGVAYYWSILQGGYSAAQNFDRRKTRRVQRLFFMRDGQRRVVVIERAVRERLLLPEPLVFRPAPPLFFAYPAISFSLLKSFSASSAIWSMLSYFSGSEEMTTLSPAKRGRTCMWQCQTVWPATLPLLRKRLKPSALMVRMRATPIFGAILMMRLA